MFHVYILRCADKSLYVGHCEDLDTRLARHRSGKAAAWTAKRRPVTLVYSEPFATRADAIARERQLKRWTHAKKTALIAGNTDELKRLANVFTVKFQGTESSKRPLQALGERTVIPILDVLVEDTLDYPSALAFVADGERLYGVDEAGGLVGDLPGVGLSSMALQRIRWAFDEAALPADHESDKGLYQGVVLVFPGTCLPLDDEVRIKEPLERLFWQLLLDKIEAYFGMERDTREAQLLASSVMHSQTMLFFSNFPIHLCTTNGALDFPKFIELMADPRKAREAEAKAEYVPLHHLAEPGKVERVQETDSGIQVIVHVYSKEGIREVRYDGLLATHLSPGDDLERGDIVGLILNPHHAADRAR